MDTTITETLTTSADVRSKITCQLDTFIISLSDDQQPPNPQQVDDGSDSDCDDWIPTKITDPKDPRWKGKDKLIYIEPDGKSSSHPRPRNSEGIVSFEDARDMIENLRLPVYRRPRVPGESPGSSSGNAAAYDERYLARAMLHKGVIRTGKLAKQRREIPLSVDQVPSTQPDNVKQAHHITTTSVGSLPKSPRSPLIGESAVPIESKDEACGLDSDEWPWTEFEELDEEQTALRYVTPGVTVYEWWPESARWYPRSPLPLQGEALLYLYRDEPCANSRRRILDKNDKMPTDWRRYIPCSSSPLKWELFEDDAVEWSDGSHSSDSGHFLKRVELWYNSGA